MRRRPTPRVLVVYKKSAYQLYLVERRDRNLLQRLRRRDPDVLDMRAGHLVQQRTLRIVTETLAKLRVPHTLVYRAALRAVGAHDLVVSVGGDGTMLQTSHLVDDTPVLGVNSDPLRSEAVFCGATAATFPRVFRRVLAGEAPVRRLARLQLALNGNVVGPLALNDVLIAHADPATMSRYRLTIGARRESQKSSGVWIATAAGSSSAIFAAGGRRLPWTAAKFQYKPRELYVGRLSRNRLTGGVLPASTRVEVVWLMREGLACIDGPHVRHPLRFGDRLTVTLSRRHPLRLLGTPLVLA